MQPDGSPCCCRRIEKIVFPNPRWSVAEISLDIMKHRAQEIESFARTRSGSLVVNHRMLSGKRPEADLRMHLERPALAIRSDCVLHLPDLMRNSPSLPAQASSGLVPIYGTCLGVVCCSQRRPTRCGEHAGATWLAEQFTSSVITRSGGRQGRNACLSMLLVDQ
jgi:hypothetical protein